MRHIVFIATVLLCGCGLTDSEQRGRDIGARRAELQTARSQWQAARIEDCAYSIWPDGGTRCPPLRVSVAGGEVAAVNAHPDWLGGIEPEELPEITESCARTVDDLFSALEGRVETADRWIVSYNGSFGYPERAFVDPSLGQADEELGWRTTGFEVP